MPGKSGKTPHVGTGIARELTDAELEKVAGAGDPLPYPDVPTGDTSSTGVKISGKPVDTSSSTGDTGTPKDTTVSTGAGKGSFNTGSFDVKVEGKPINIT